MQLQMEKNKAQEESYRQQIRELANENKQHQHTIVELVRMCTYECMHVCMYAYHSYVHV